MVLRWTVAGMPSAERSFRRIKGDKQMPQLVAALPLIAVPVTDRLSTHSKISLRASPWPTQPVVCCSGSLMAKSVGPPGLW